MRIESNIERVGYVRLEDGHPSTEILKKSQKNAWNVFDLFARLICVFMFMSGALMLWTAQPYNVSDGECARRLSIWSPVFESVDYEVRDFAASTSATRNKYDGPPTFELEEAWENLENMPAVLVPSSRIPSLQRNVSQNFVKSTTLGKEGYIATVEVFHHLHCLNIVRQFVWRDQYPKDLVPWLMKHNSALVARAHVGHCIATLREALMCNADLTPYLWYEGEDGKPAREDFKASHKCKRWGSIVEGVLENAVDIPLEAVRGMKHDHSD